MSSTPTYSGGCFCKAVRYQVSGTPIRSSYCHCTLCQRLTACPFVNTLHFNESEFKWMTADNIESITDTYEVETKPWKRRWRCKKCGGGVASENMKLRRWSIWGATLDRDDDGRIIGWAQLKPKAHIFYGTRLLDVEDGLDKWEGYENESRRL